MPLAERNFAQHWLAANSRRKIWKPLRERLPNGHQIWPGFNRLLDAC